VRFENFLSFLIVELLGVDWLECISVVELGKFLGDSFLTAFFEPLHTSLQGVLGHGVVGDKDVSLVYMIVRVDEISGDGSIAFIGLSAKYWDKPLRFVAYAS
jgi:hypothetical protein